MRVGIVGFASSGKTTLFNTLTGLEADTGFGRKDKVNTGVIDVPDERLDKIAEIINPRRILYAKITFTDVPGGNSGGNALDAQMLQEIRNVEALVHVVRAFRSQLVAGAPDPLKEIRDFQDELKIADQIIIERRIERLAREKGSELEKALLPRLLEHLESGGALRTLDLNEQDLNLISGYRFVSLKPIILVLNVEEDAMTSEETKALIEKVQAELGLTPFPISAALEAEIAQLEPEEQEAFLAELGLPETPRNRFIQSAYAALELISYITQGVEEVRAWTIKRHTNAKRAARAIHSDLERGFIRAEVIPYEAFMHYRSEAACKEAGKARVEGKDYIVQDGDILHIRANV